VRALRTYGVERFAIALRGLGLTTLFRHGSDYGLPLILGGAEVRLWEITSLYAGLARSAAPSINSVRASHSAVYSSTNPPPRRTPDVIQSKASEEVFFPSHFYAGNPARGGQRLRFSPGAAWLTLDALTFVNRPGEEAHWQEYAGARRIAWKTGTSYGNRDAWAIGTTPAWTVGVWVGNASGEGRPRLTSSGTSAPVLFDLFSSLDSIFPVTGNRPWFPQPALDVLSIDVCAHSGFPAGLDCGRITSAYIPLRAPRHNPCPYCRTVALNLAGDRRITVESNGEDVRMEKWFVLPPAEEWYFRRWNLDYKPLPPLHQGNLTETSIQSLALFNPESNAQIFIPRELDGREGRVVFNAAHRDNGERIFWHLDNIYLGETVAFHDMEARPGAGFHTLTLVDGRGNRISRRFEVLSNAD
jgi:penicillin-binding protein 1C